MKISDVHFSYGDKCVLSGVSFGIKTGEIVGIIGPNGAGKTTLVRIMGGLLKQSAGDVFLDGVSIQSIPERMRARQIAFVPQESHIPFSFSALEIALMGRAAYISPFGFESKHDIGVALSAMKKTDCDKFAGRDITTLSGGERQRVILARALAQETRIMLLDEPTTFLDIRHQVEIHRLLRDLSRAGSLTIVSAMHDLNLAANFCDRVIALKDGKVYADGRPDEVINTQIIRAVFGADVEIKTDPVSHFSYCAY